MDDDSRCALCGQLMGMVRFFISMVGASPSVFTLTTNKFAIKHVHKYTLALAGSKCLPDSTLKKQLQSLHALFTFYHGTLHSIYQSHGENSAEFQLTLRHTWDTYLPFIHCYGDFLSSTFFNVPKVTLPKKYKSVYLTAYQLLQSCQRRPGVISGCIFYREKVLCSQLSPQLTSKLLIIRPKQSHLPCQQISVAYKLSDSVRLISVYLTAEEFRSLSYLKCKERDKKHCEHSLFLTSTTDLPINSAEQSWREISTSSFGDSLSKTTTERIRDLEFISSSVESSFSWRSSDQSVRLENVGPYGDKFRGSFSSVSSSCEGPKYTTSHKNSFSRVETVNGNYVKQRETSSGSQSFQDRTVSEKDPAKFRDIGVDTKDLTGNNFADSRPENVNTKSEFTDDINEKQRCETLRPVEDVDDKKLSNHVHENVSTEVFSNKWSSSDESCQTSDSLDSAKMCASSTMIDTHSQALSKTETLDCSTDSEDEYVMYNGSDIDEFAELIVKNVLVKVAREFHTGENSAEDNADVELDLRYELSDIDDVIDCHRSHVEADGPATEMPGAYATDANKVSDQNIEDNDVRIDVGANVEPRDNVHSESNVKSECDQRVSALSCDNVEILPAGGQIVDGLSTSPDNKGTYIEEAKVSPVSGQNCKESFSAAFAKGPVNLCSDETSRQSKVDKEMSELENVELYVQGYHDIVVVMVMEKGTSQNVAVVKALHNSVTLELEALNSHLKSLTKKEFKENIRVENNYFIQYDCMQRNLSGNTLSPVSLEEHEFCETAIRMHEEFLTSPTLTDVTLRSHLGSTYGHCSMNQETYFHPWGSHRPISGEPSEKDAAMLLDNRAQKRIAFDNNLLLL